MERGRVETEEVNVLKLSVSPPALIDFYIISIQKRHKQLGPIAQSIKLSIHPPSPHYLHVPVSGTYAGSYSMGELKNLVSLLLLKRK